MVLTRSPRQLGDLPHGHSLATKPMKFIVVESSARTTDASPTTAGLLHACLRPLDEAGAFLFGAPRETAMSKFLTGPPVSSHVSLTLITVTPSLSSSSTSWRLPTIDRPNLSSAHTMSDVEPPPAGVLEHRLVLRPVPRAAGLLVVDVDDLEASGLGDLLDLGALVVGGLRAVRLAHTDVDGSAGLHVPTTTQGPFGSTEPCHSGRFWWSGVASPAPEKRALPEGLGGCPFWHGLW